MNLHKRINIYWISRTEIALLILLCISCFLGARYYGKYTKLKEQMESHTCLSKNEWAKYQKWADDSMWQQIQADLAFRNCYNYYRTYKKIPGCRH